MVRKRKDGHDDQRFKDAWSDKKSKGYQPDGNWWSWMILILTLGILDFRFYVDKKNGKYKDPIEEMQKRSEEIREYVTKIEEEKIIKLGELKEQLSYLKKDYNKKIKEGEAFSEQFDKQSIEKEIRKREKEIKLREKYPDLGDTKIELMLDSRYYQGMSREQLIDCLGHPEDIKSSHTNNVETEKFYYSGEKTIVNTTEYGLIITLKNGKIVSYKESEIILKKTYCKKGLITLENMYQDALKAKLSKDLISTLDSNYKFRVESINEYKNGSSAHEVVKTMIQHHIDGFEGEVRSITP